MLTEPRVLFLVRGEAEPGYPSTEPGHPSTDPGHPGTETGYPSSSWYVAVLFRLIASAHFWSRGILHYQDEPTTGLDSATADDVMHLVQTLATRGRTVLAPYIPSTVHIDPSTVHIGPSTVHVDPSTVHIDPSTVRIDPSTVRIDPSTIHTPSPPKKTHLKHERTFARLVRDYIGIILPCARVCTIHSPSSQVFRTFSKLYLLHAGR
eukprot:1184298-Prorocentrum_minimum.AAC.1